MTLEETHEEDDIEASDAAVDPSPPTPPTPRRDPIGRLSGDKKERQLQTIVADGRKKCLQKSCRVCGSQKNIKTQDIPAKHSKSSCVKKLASRDTTPG
jgi:hypothetical protein